MNGDTVAYPFADHEATLNEKRGTDASHRACGKLSLYVQVVGGGRQQSGGQAEPLADSGSPLKRDFVWVAHHDPLLEELPHRLAGRSLPASLRSRVRCGTDHGVQRRRLLSSAQSVVVVAALPPDPQRIDIVARVVQDACIRMHVCRAGLRRGGQTGEGMFNT